MLNKTYTWEFSMESALFKFLSRRQAFCKSALDMVYVENLGGGAVNECFGNAYDQLRQQGITIVSGWLAEPLQTLQPLRHSQVQRQFTQHWWNFDGQNRKYFDTSPEIEKGAIYILDRDIALFAVDNIERLSSCVSRSVVYMSGEFYTAEHTLNGYGLQAAPDLSTERLFASFVQPKSQFPI
jgi:hypothetical protein